MPYCAADKYSQNGSLATLWRRQRGVAGDLTSLFIISAWLLAVGLQNPRDRERSFHGIMSTQSTRS
jgi:hypothetical protein